MSVQIGFTNKASQTVKNTVDRDLHLEIKIPDPNLRWRLATDYNTGKLHYIDLRFEQDTIISKSISTQNTGFYFFRLQYSQDNKNWQDSEYLVNVHVDPDWIYDAIVYNVFLRAFSKKQTSDIHPGEGGTFTDVIKHMDEFVTMGINVLYFNPFHIIGETYRKYNPNDHLPGYLQPGSPYSIKDFKSIDPEVAFPQKNPNLLLTDPNKQFRKLVQAAHRRGIRVIMDLVFNHTAHDFIMQRIFPEWFLYKEHIDSPDDPYIYPEEIADGKPWGDPKHTVSPYNYGEFAWKDTAQLNWEYQYPPAPNKPPKNTKKKQMYEYFKSIPKYWIKEFGIDGFRADIAYNIPMDFWQQCILESRKIAKKSYPQNGAIDGEVIFIAESHEDKLKELFEAGFSLVYGNYSNKLFSPLQLKGYLDYMYNLSGDFFPQNAKWFIFPECHDFDRNTSKLVLGHLTTEAQNDHNEKEEMAVRGNLSRWVLTATLPGVPMIFMGFEKVEWQTIDHISYSKIDWQNHKDIHQEIAIVNQIRHSHNALQKGNYRYLENSQGLNEKTQLFAYYRYLEKEIMLIVVNMDINNSAQGEIFLEKLTYFDPNKAFILKDLLSNKIYYRKNDHFYVSLKPGQSHIFTVEQDWGDAK